MKNIISMKKLFIVSLLLISSMRTWAQADLGIASAIMNTNPISVGQTAQLVVDVRNFGFTNITTGCALVTISVPSSICSITGLNASSNGIWAVHYSGALPASITIRNLGGVLPANGNPYYIYLNVQGTVNGGPSTINASSALAGTIIQSGCTGLGNLSTFNDAVTSSITVGPTNYTWTGASNTVWNNIANWSSFVVPTAIDNAIIPNVTNKPALTADATINNITIDPSAFVDINGKTFTINGTISGTGKLRGSSASSLIIGGAAGTLNFDQTSASTHSLKSLTIQAGSASLASSGDDLDIYSSIILNTGTSLNLNGQLLTLKSTGTGPLNSAYISNLTGCTLSNATNVTVERYIAAPQRAWHLLSARAVTGTQTIRQAWQENAGSYTPGMGTLVTSNLYTPSNGFDMVSNSASVITHNQGGLSGPSWNYNLSNTNNTIVSSYPGYMVFVRGDRSETPATAPSTEPTVLRTHGTLTQGPQSALVSSLGTGRTLVGNPYTSPIDMEPVFSGTANLSQDMFIWDPSLGGVYGVGGFRVVERTAPGVYEATPSMGASQDNTLRYIHSGQAFFLKTLASDGSADATVNFTESMKTANLGAVNPIVNTGSQLQLITSLLFVDPAGPVTLLDACRVRFDDSYSAKTTDDVIKMSNFGENVSSYRDGLKLIIEKRPPVTSRDTIFLRLGNTGVKQYRFRFEPQHFNSALQAWLQDSYLNQLTPIDLTAAVTEVDFSVTSDAASANPDRFRILFSVTAPLPVTLKIKAARQDDNILVGWNVFNQQSVDHYELEKSINGTSFSKVNTQLATGVNGSDAAYSWLDKNPVAGDNYYRVKSISAAGDTRISDIVKVKMDNTGPVIALFPNPVTNRTVMLQMNNCDKGIYQYRLLNTLGQVIMSSSFSYAGGTAAQTIRLASQIANGNYRLEIVKPDNTRLTKELVVADK